MYLMLGIRPDLGVSVNKLLLFYLWDQVIWRNILSKAIGIGVLLRSETLWKVVVTQAPRDKIGEEKVEQALGLIALTCKSSGKNLIEPYTTAHDAAEKLKLRCGSSAIESQGPVRIQSSQLQYTKGMHFTSFCNVFRTTYGKWRQETEKAAVQKMILLLSDNYQWMF